MRRRLLAIVVLGACAFLAATATPGCGGQRAREVDSLDGIDAGKRVRIEGTLSLRGSTPLTIPTLTTSGGVDVPLDSKDPDVLTQLRRLSEMRVAVEGDVLPLVDNNLPRLSATRYELLALPDGTVPIVGVVSVEDGDIIVTSDTGRRLWIHGDLVGVLEEYAGARVWVVGGGFNTHSPRRPKKSTPWTATGYGVIDETPAH